MSNRTGDTVAPWKSNRFISRTIAVAIVGAGAIWWMIPKNELSKVEKSAHVHCRHALMKRFNAADPKFSPVARAGFERFRLDFSADLGHGKRPMTGRCFIQTYSTDVTLEFD